MLEHCIITYLEMFFHMVLNGFRGCEGSWGLGRRGLDDKEAFGSEVGCRTMMMMHSLEVSGFPRKHLDGSSPNSSLFYTQSPQGSLLSFRTLGIALFSPRG